MSEDGNNKNQTNAQNPELHAVFVFDCKTS